MKILVLGSEGFVGKNLVKGLSEQHEIYSADLVDHSNHENYTKFDITNPDSVNKTVKNVDVVINLVAHSLVSSLESSSKNAQVNIIGLLNVLDACKNNNIEKIIFTSASSMIGEPTTERVSETHLAKPKTAYGITKLASEHYLRLYKELYDLNFVVFRFFNIYGPFQKNGLIPTLYSRIMAEKPLTVFGKGDQIRDYVYIEDIIPFFEKASSSNIADNSTFNMGTGLGTSIVEIIKLFENILTIKPKIEYQPLRPGEIGNFVANTELLSSTFGMTPKTSVEYGLQKTIDWLKNN